MYDSFARGMVGNLKKLDLIVYSVQLDGLDVYVFIKMRVNEPQVYLNWLAQQFVNGVTDQQIELKLLSHSKHILQIENRRRHI